MIPKLLFNALVFIAVLYGNEVYGQPAVVDSGMNKVTKFLLNLKPNALKAMDKQYAKMEKKLTKQSSDYLARLEKHEEKMKKKLAKTDSTKAEQTFGDIKQRYTALRNKLTQSGNKIQKISHYIPGLDSISTATKYLSQVATSIPNYPTGNIQLLQQLNGNVAGVRQQMQNATDIKQLLRQRETDLKQQLMNTVVSKELDVMNKEVYYYQQQLNQYREIFNDPDKLTQQVLGVLRETPVFQSFMSRFSILAQLFPMPANMGTAQALAGLQTNAAVQQQLTQQMGGVGGGMNPQAMMQQQMQGAQTELDQLKNKVSQMGSNSSDIEMPNFTPNSQKTKSFLKRIEYGLNIQSQKTVYLLPTTSDIALTIGYKLSDKATIGVGGSYKLGWGKSINNISLSNQGMGLRTYTDIKLKGSIWITGGYEQNWLPQLATILDSANVHPSGWGNGWQSSGLIGLTKKMKIGKQTSNMQVLWDFLSYSQIPRTTAFKFRIGYTF